MAGRCSAAQPRAPVPLGVAWSRVVGRKTCVALGLGENTHADPFWGCFKGKRNTSSCVFAFVCFSFRVLFGVAVWLPPCLQTRPLEKRAKLKVLSGDKHECSVVSG